MAKIYVNLFSFTNTATAPWNVNAFGNGSQGIGQLSSDLTDLDSNLTGIGLSVTNAFNNVDGSASATEDVGDWSKEALSYGFRADATGGGLQLTGLTNGDTYTIELAGHVSQSVRDTYFTVDGVTTLYDCAGTGVPNAPIVFSGTVSGTTIDIDVARFSAGTVYGYINGLTLTVTSVPPTLAITDIDGDDDVFHGQVTTLTGTLLGADGGTLTIGGVDQIVASNTATTANITIVSDSLGYGLHDAVWTDTELNTSPPFPVTISPAAGLQVVTAASPVLNSTSLFNGVIPTVTDGDLLETPTATTQGKALTTRADGTFLITDAASAQQTFAYRVYHPSLGTWTNYGNVTVN